MSLLTSINEKSPGDYFFALAESNKIAKIAGAGNLGTLTNSSGTISHTFTLPGGFKTGVYFVQIQIQIAVNTATAGDTINFAIYQDGVIGQDQLNETFIPAGLTSGESGLITIAGYISTLVGTNTLRIITGAYTLGSSSSYTIVNPTNSFVYIQQVA